MSPIHRSPIRVCLILGFATLTLFAAGCGGGGGGGDEIRTGDDTLPVILTLQTPLGLQGTRGVGADVTVVYQLRDREFDAADIEVQFGVDLDRDATIAEAEFAAATPGAGGDGLTGLNTSPGNGSIHIFVWDSLADVTSDRYVTQDFEYTETGRVKLDDFNEPVFRNFPGVVVRMRPMADAGVGAWRYSEAFDLNNNNRPQVTVDSVEIPAEGAADNTVNEQVLVNWTGIDPDGDPLTIAVDWVAVDQAYDVGSKTPEELEALPWAAATSGALGEGTYDLTATPAGVSHLYAWDSAKDAGTVNQWMLLRFRPIDGKLEVGDWFYSSAPFHLDNYTIFTDPGTVLPTALAGSRAVLLRESVESVLITGGAESDGGDGTDFAGIFYPGRSQTTLGTVAEIPGGMEEERVGHTATRLLDGRVLIVGGGGAGGSVSDTAEIYDPSTGAFTLLTDTMTSERRDHVAVLLTSGDVLVAGGRDSGGANLASGEIFKLATSTFEDVSAALPMGDARYGAAATLLPDGRVLVSGGRGNTGALKTTELYDPALSSGAGGFGITDVGSDLGAAREGLTVTGTLDAQYAAVAAGGMASPPVATLERYDWMTDDWSNSSASMRSARAFHSSVLLGDGRILIAGGDSDGSGALTALADLYDPSADTMDVPNGDMRVAVRNSAVAILERGRPVFFGGLSSSAATDAIQVFTPDGGFNERPLAQVADMLGALEPWSFGVRILWRAIDVEGDPVRIVCQFKVKPDSELEDNSSSLPSSVLNQWRPATMRAQTVLGEKSSGLTALSSRQDFVDTVDNPIDAPDVDPGEHRFVWDTQKDLPKGDYKNVFFRIFIYGAEEGTGVESARFSIAKNAPVISRIEAPLNTSGNVVVPFFLQDGDEGDLARLEWQYGIDLSSPPDGKIVESEGESWVTVQRATVGSTVSGTTYYDAGLNAVVMGTQDPDPNNDYTDPNGIPWGKKHYLVWDSVYDVGSPDSPRTDLILRVTPYDYNNDASNLPGNHPESLGIVQQISGFTLERDTTGIYLENAYASVASTGSTYMYEGVRLDEPLVFEFSAPVDPASIALPDGKSAISIYKEGGGTFIHGYYLVDNSSGKGKVTFYPQVQDLPQTRTDILVANTGYTVVVHGYDPGDRGHAIVKRLGADPSDTNARMLLAGVSLPKAFRTASGSLPSQLYLADSASPSYSSMDPLPNATGVSSNGKITVIFDDHISPGSVNPTSFIAVAKKYTGVDSVVPGDFTLENIVDESGPGGTLRKYARLTLTPSLVLPPDTTTIEVRIGTGLRDMRGNFLSAGKTNVFTTAAGNVTLNGSRTEGFNSTTNRNEDETTAFWGTADPKNKGAAAGSGVAGKLTGLYDGGNGINGPLDLAISGNVTLTTSTSVKQWQYTYVNIPYGRTLTVKGTQPASIRVQGDVTISGTVNASGSNGANSSGRTSTGSGPAGGAAGPGGGAGGGGTSYTYKSTTRLDGKDGKAAASDTNGTSPGEGGLGAQYGAPGQSSTYWSGGGAGAGHASAGGKGGDAYTYYGRKGGAGGKTYGTASLANGPESGSGGGGGGSSIMYYTYYSWYGAAFGATGGGGGGGLLFSSNGKITLASTGKILANGGNGGTGNSYRAGTTIYPGGGGGGSAGSVFLQGNDLDLSGAIEVLGGTGGPTPSSSYPGPGGAGGDGRIRLERPGFSGKLFNGKLYTSSTLFSTGNGGSNDWKITSDTTVNTDSGLGVPGYLTRSGGKILVKDFILSATLTVTGSKALIIESSGKVEIKGSIVAKGAKGSNQSSSRYGSYSGWRFLRMNGGAAAAGGFKGGDNGWNSSYSSSFPKAEDGFGINGKAGGSGGGEAGATATTPYNWSPSSSYTYRYYYYAGGGGGGGGAVAGTTGTTRKARGIYSGTPGDGGAAAVNGLNLTGSNMYGGPGGGGGAPGGYKRDYTTRSDYHYSYGPSAGGGSGGGGILISTDGTMLLSGSISTPGGDGGNCSYSGSYAYYPGPGGAGAGGNVVLQADGGFTFGLMSIDCAGGAAGNNWYSTTSYGSGGNGGVGAITLRSDETYVTPPDLPSGGKFGNGTMTGGDFVPTKYGVSTWFDSGAVAPAYVGRTVVGSGWKLWVEGAHTDLLTGNADASVTPTWVDVTSGDLSALNGYRFFRFRAELMGVSGSYPEVSSVQINWSWRGNT